MNVYTHSSGRSWFWPARDATDHRSWWPGRMVRSWGVAAVLALLLSSSACLGLLAYFSDADTLREERVQQEMLTGYAARFLSSRIEMYQRVLQSMGQGMHSNVFDSPSLLELPFRDDSGYAGIFDALWMTGSNGAVVSYASVSQPQAASSLQRDALRRTLSDGKPLVLQIPADEWATEKAAQLVLLVTVPLRNSAGAVHGALAGIVHWTQGSLLPQPSEQAAGQQFMLVDEHDQLLAHSDASQPLGHIAQQLGGHRAQWAALSSVGTSNADSQVWDSLLVSRVGMPLPRWQVVAVRDLAPRLLGMQRLSVLQWLGLLATAVSIALVLLGMLWWLSRPLARLLNQGAKAAPSVPQAIPLMVPGMTPQSLLTHPVAEEPDEAQRIERHWQELETQLAQALTREVSAQAGLEQLLAALPIGVVWLDGDVVQHATRHAAHLLGMDVTALQGLRLAQLISKHPETMPALEAAKEAIAGFGRCSLDAVWLTPLTREQRLLRVQGLQLRMPAQGSVWLLRDARQIHAAQQQPEWLAENDRLTGLALRSNLLARMHAYADHQSEAVPSETVDEEVAKPQAMLWLDVDYLEAVNAMVGREAGDEVLRQVAWLLQYKQARWSMAARVGSDDFVLWTPQAPDSASVQTLAWRLCEVVQHWTPRFAGKRCALTVSVGWVWVNDPVEPAALLDAAEEACREAKKAGQGRAVQGFLA